MKKNVIFINLILFVLFTFSHISCQKAKEEANGILTAEESATASTLFDDIFRQVDNAAKMVSEPASLKSNVFGIGDGGCGTITIEPLGLTFPKTITIDFGDTNCKGIDQRDRRGIITAVITDWYRSEGCTLTITLENYYVNDFQVEGTKVITNMGRNDSQNMYFTVEVSNGVITYPEGETFTCASTRTREWIEGEETYLNLLDDVYEITGSGSGTTSDNKEYSISITKALNIAVNCLWIRSGTIDIQVNNTTLTVDYGDGTCDPNATATIFGQTFPFIMR